MSRAENKKVGTKKYINTEKIIENGLSEGLGDNIEIFKKLFSEDDTLIIRKTCE